MMTVVESAFQYPAAYWLALMCLCSAYVQGGVSKLVNFADAVNEIKSFGLWPASPLAAAVIVLELSASAMILLGYYRWIAAVTLAGFTLLAALLANPLWHGDRPHRTKLLNTFFEHVGLVGGFLLVASIDLQARSLHSPT